MFHLGRAGGRRKREEEAGIENKVVTERRWQRFAPQS